jgi:CHAT domain-containing protein
MFGAYRSDGGDRALPRVVRVQISRYQRALPRRGKPLEFLVGIHEEGTTLAWQQNVTVEPDTEAALLAAVEDLHAWSTSRGLTKARALQRAEELGIALYDTFIGAEGTACLAGIAPTAVLLGVDETVLNLPWELLWRDGRAIVDDVPFGRLVTTRILPRPRRDPLREDATVEILVVADPTSELPSTAAELEVLQSLDGDHDGVAVKVRVLTGGEATCAGLADALAGDDFDIVHVAAHAGFDDDTPTHSALRLADGTLEAGQVLDLAWAAPPYIVFNSACESGRAAAGRRLVGKQAGSNGLAAAFLAAGSEAYLGYFWPVDDGSARVFTEVFYSSLFTTKNVGTAVHEARAALRPRFGDDGDLTAYNAIFFGDAGTAERRDIAMAV